MHPTVGTLQFAEPLWLIGAAAALGPLFAHWWANRPGKPTYFPAVELLIASQRTQTRQRELTDLLLLIARCAAVVLVAIAFARPTWEEPATDPTPTANRRNVAIVLDASGSMQQRVRGGSAFEAARREAAAFVRSLDAQREQVVVVIADAQPHAIWPTPSDRLDALADAIERQQVSDAFASLDQSVRLARRAAGPGANVHVFTDGQRQAWADAPGTGITLHRAVDAGATVPNAGIESMRIEPAVVVIGRPAELVVRVRNYADDTLTVRVHIDGLAGVHPQSLELSAGESAEARFTFVARRTKPLRLTAAVETEGDALAADDRAMLTVEPQADIDVAVTPGGHALLPVIEPSKRSPFRAVTVEPEHLADSPASVWVVTGSPALSGMSAGPIADPQPIDARIRNGTHVLIVDASLDVHPSRAMSWSPARPTKRRLDAAGLNPATLLPGTLASFDDKAAAALADLPIPLRTHVEPLPGANVLMRYTDDEPAIVEWPYGEGRVILLTFDITNPSRSGETLRSATLLPLVHELLHRLIGHATAEARPSLDPRERDLATLAERSPPDDVMTDNATPRAEATRVSREPIDLWPWALAAALAFLSIECIGSSLIARRRESEAAA